MSSPVLITFLEKCIREPSHKTKDGTKSSDSVVNALHRISSLDAPFVIRDDDEDDETGLEFGDDDDDDYGGGGDVGGGTRSSDNDKNGINEPSHVIDELYGDVYTDGNSNGSQSPRSSPKRSDIAFLYEDDNAFGL